MNMTMHLTYLLRESSIFICSFVTNKAILNYYQGNVRWQLLLLVGMINISKHTGTYGLMKPRGVVYKSISLQGNSMTLSLDGGGHKLRWTILNVRGKQCHFNEFYAAKCTNDIDPPDNYFKTTQ